MKNKWIIVGFIANYILLAIIMIVLFRGGGGLSFGAIGTKLIEDYVPVVKYNEGLKTALPIQASGTLAVTGSTLLNGTTTIPCSYDGTMAQKNFTMSTGTAKAVITNTCGANLMCQSGNVYWDSTAFSPSLVLAIGTSTSATGYATGLMSSTTIASTSDTALNVYSGNPFILPIGSSIIGALSDYNTTGASSTYYTNWTTEMGFSCRLMGA